MNRTEALLTEQFHEFREAALFVRAEVIVNVPAEVIFAEFTLMLAYPPEFADGVFPAGNPNDMTGCVSRRVFSSPSDRAVRSFASLTSYWSFHLTSH